MSRKKYIDRIDIDLLNALSSDPKKNVAQLGDEVDLTPGPTHTRLTHLREEGFFKNINEVDYAKFGLEEYLLSIKLVKDSSQLNQFNPEDIFEKCIKKLERVKDSLITSIDLLKTEGNESFLINVNYFDRYSKEIIEKRNSKSNRASHEVNQEEEEVKNLLSEFLNDYTLNKIIKKENINPLLDRGHIIRKNPKA